MIATTDGITTAEQIRSAVLTAADFAALLGRDTRTFRAWEKAGIIGPAPVLSFGHALYGRDEVNHWLAERNPETSEYYRRSEWPAIWSAWVKRRRPVKN